MNETEREMRMQLCYFFLDVFCVLFCFVRPCTKYFTHLMFRRDYLDSTGTIIPSIHIPVKHISRTFLSCFLCIADCRCSKFLEKDQHQALRLL